MEKPLNQFEKQLLINDGKNYGKNGIKQKILSYQILKKEI
jgi:hypothetical protein